MSHEMVQRWSDGRFESIQMVIMKQPGIQSFQGVPSDPFMAN
ncbi:MAG: hypothetical protein PHR90_02490 [Sphaerochaetaceae bacterium]|nr:hypothetical protein [Sphaerochaetaceae bacterium]